MDRRQQKTRKAILDAFGTLLSKRSFSQITVQDIIDEANIGRTTFYAHFDTKDALFEEMCSDLFKHVFSDSLHAEESHDFSGKEEDPREAIVHILYHLLDNEKNIRGILSGESGDMFFRYFKRYSDDLIPKALIGKINSRDRIVPRSFLSYHISMTFVSTIQWWVKSGFKQTPEEIVDYYLAVIEPALD